LVNGKCGEKAPVPAPRGASAVRKTAYNRRMTRPKPATRMLPESAPEPKPFWQAKRLEQMTQKEWESLCDGCGRCCLNKLEEEGTGNTFFTDVACRLLDTAACRCRDYANRKAKVPDCVKLTPRSVRRIPWLPPTCAYRLLAEGRDLYWWHPLVSGDAESVHAAGVSVRARISLTEDEVPDDQLEKHIVSWPGKVPKASRQSVAGKGK
jgi:hypothetical protein